MMTLSDRNNLVLVVGRAFMEFDRLATIVEDNTGENPAGTIDKKLAAHLRQAAVELRKRQARMMKLYAEIQPEEIPGGIAPGMSVAAAASEANKIGRRLQANLRAHRKQTCDSKTNDSGPAKTPPAEPA
jgi:hypothetical protein